MASLREQLTVPNSSYTWKYKSDWLSFVITTAERHGCPLGGGRVLEVGAGIHNPLASALIALSRGAASAVAIEPGPIEQDHLEHAAASGLIEFYKHCNEDLKGPLYSIIEALIDNDAEPLTSRVQLFRGNVAEYSDAEPFTVVHSNAVLEHVQDFPGTCKRFAEMTAKGGLHVHKVDFIDHRYYKLATPTPFHAHRWLMIGQEDELSTCNRLRMNEVIQHFEDAGFLYIDAPEVWRQTPPKEVLKNLQPHFHKFSVDELSVTAATLVFRRWD